jgi:inosine triphosphate pyrophosphatase
MSTQTIYYITSNEEKFKEVAQIIGEVKGCRFERKNFRLSEFQGKTPEEVAVEKCKKALEIAKCPILIESTSLCFNALGGLPGPYTKWFLEELKPEGK